ncbi:MAG: guanylate kinase [Proteobacteria bacterium]|nr:guanylate kinase [Pseudomonadota bacterium]MCH9758541.1 guanylate kinase [Pseudomonadota bacterium]
MAKKVVSMGRLYVMSAPSGAGKTSISNRLTQEERIKISISHTTRAPRANEQDGQAYFFVSKAEFILLRETGDFLEWADVYGNYYGTSRVWVEKQLALGNNVLLEIDCQGALQIRKLQPQAVMIFIAPPTMEILRQRLYGRSQEDEEILKRRLHAAEMEMEQQNHFDYVIINDTLEDAVAEVAAIIHQHSPEPLST